MTLDMPPWPAVVVFLLAVLVVVLFAGAVFWLVALAIEHRGRLGRIERDHRGCVVTLEKLDGRVSLLEELHNQRVAEEGTVL